MSAMRIYALIGKSGTGKSHHSMEVAKKYRLEYIIDDGLLISENRIVAGKSAKRAETKMASVRRTVFNNPEHAEKMRKAIQKAEVSSLLIIGTSEKMVKMIAEALHLPPIEYMIHIEEITTEKERQIAHDMRFNEGKHVIPAPTFEVKKQFSGYFIDPLVLWFKGKGGEVMEEKTIIRPTYSYLGKYRILDRAIMDICEFEIHRFKSVTHIYRIKVATSKGGRLILDIDIALRYPCDVKAVSSKIAKKVWESLEEYTSMNVKSLNVNIKTLELSNKSC